MKSSSPQHVVQMVPIDKHGKIMLMHRSSKVRSVPNVWSFPSGLHDFGESIYGCAARELEEEFNLKSEKFALLGVYENVPGDGYHWVITVMLVLVESFDDMINNEPDKHDATKIVDQHELLADSFFEDHIFHGSFVEWARAAFPSIIERLSNAF